MTCEDVMTRNPVWCVPTDTVDQVAQVMKSEDIGALPVCASRVRRQLVGIVTDRDLTIHIVAEGRNAATARVQEAMTPQPLACHPEDDLEEVLDTMQRYQIRRVPIIDGDGELVGIISQADIATRGDEPEQTAETVGEISRPSAQAA